MERICSNSRRSLLGNTAFYSLDYLPWLGRMKNIKKTALRWRQQMEEAPRDLCPNDLSDEAFIEVLERALWKKGKSLDVEGDYYTIIE